MEPPVDVQGKREGALDVIIGLVITLPGLRLRPLIAVEHQGDPRLNHRPVALVLGLLRPPSAEATLDVDAMPPAVTATS